MRSRVAVMGGLCNRIRSILSYRSQYGEIEVLWARSEGVCRSTWADVLEPLEGVTFTDIGDGPAQDYAGPCDVAPTCGLAPDAKPGWTTAYAELRPTLDVLLLVGACQSMIHCEAPTYQAIHARRTDHVDHSRRYGHHTTNEELGDWMRPQAGPLYLATDCLDTREWFASRFRTYGPRPVRVTGYDVRSTTLRQAVIDLWMCVGASAFRGSWFSSFSETIEAIRCGGVYPGGFDPHVHMPSQDTSYEVRA